MAMIDASRHLSGAHISDHPAPAARNSASPTASAGVEARARQPV